MNDNLNSKNSENNDNTLINKDIDYENLINRLKEISKTIDLLEKNI